jgi:HAD superfamily hydrolase (TIGR01509 family)
MPHRPAALLWDVDGTLAETELDGHRLAFNRAFETAGLPWRWDVDRYLALLRISGGRERIASFLESQEGERPAAARLDALQASKQHHYRALISRGEIALRPGVRRLIEAAAGAGLQQAIVTTSGRSAVQSLLDQQLPGHHDLFAFWICGEDVEAKKPNPQAYRLALQQLDQPASEVLAIEDSANGFQAASAAGLRALITRSASSAHEPLEAFAQAAAVVDNLGEQEGTCQVLLGAACPERLVTLSYLQRLFPDS